MSDGAPMVADDATRGVWAPKPKADMAIIAVLFLLSVIPIDLGGPIDGNSVLIPLLFGITLVDVATRSKTLDYFLPGRGNVQALFVTLFFFVILISFARKPVLPAGLLGTDADTAGFKLYWRYFTCFLAYVTTIYWINRNRIPPNQIFSLFFFVALIMTITGIFMVFTGAKLPGLSGHVWEVSSTMVGATRLPFLGVFAQIGFLVALSEASGPMKRRYLYLALFALGIFLSGGRTVLFSTIAALTVWLVLNKRFALTALCLVMVLVVAGAAKVIQETAPSSQVEQLAKVGSLDEDSVMRYYLYQILIDEIIKHPVFGTGFGKHYDTELIVVRGKFVQPEFVDKQLRAGSHGTHLQILKNLGLVGYVPFLLIWIYPVFKLLPLAFATVEGAPVSLVRAARFVVLTSTTLFIRWGFEGNGSTSSDYVFAGVVCVLVSLAVDYRLKNETAVPNASVLHTSTRLRLDGKSRW